MIDLFANIEALRRSLDYHLNRHAVLGSNVANAETPGYRAMDVSFDAYLSRAERINQTNPRHMTTSGMQEFEMEVFEDPAASPGNDGNTVSLEREMAKISANTIRFKTNLEILSRRLATLKYAANDGKR